MRALILLTIVLTTTTSQAADPSRFEIYGLHLGMAPEQVREVGKKAGFGEFREIRSPSFNQAVALAQRRNVPPASYAGIQTMQAKGKQASLHIGFIQSSEGSKVSSIVYRFLDASLSREVLRADIIRQYGTPDAQRNQEWLWGDTAMYFNSRKSAYLELRFDPASAGTEKPIAILTLANPAVERATRDSIQEAARK